MSERPICTICGRILRRGARWKLSGLWCMDHGLMEDASAAAAWTWESDLFATAIKAVMPLLIDAHPDVMEYFRQYVVVRLTGSEVSFSFDTRVVDAAAGWDPPLRPSLPPQATVEHRVLGAEADWEHWGIYADSIRPEGPCLSVFRRGEPEDVGADDQ